MPSFSLAESEAMLPDGFPAGLRVFVVDDDSAVLRTLEIMLLKCGYKVTISDRSLQALELLKVNIDNYDVVLIDVNMTYMDGFQLLEIVCHEIDLPVIVLSADSDFKSVMRGMQYGAVDYLVKPVRIEELKLIWKHVVKKLLNEKKSLISHLTKQSKTRVRQRDENDNIESEDDLASQKRARVYWTPKLHEKFINAVNQLGINRAVPNKILDIMEIPGLTRQNVASHLQKYKKGLKRNTIELDQQIYDNAKTRIESESFLPTTINECNANLCNNKSISSSYLMGQQSYDGYALIPQTWFSPHMGHQNNFCPQYMMGSLENQFETHQLGLTTESHMMNKSTQFVGYQSFNQSLNQLDCQAQSYQNSWTSDGYNEPNSISQLESTIEQDATNMFLKNNLNDNNNSDELAALLTFEQKQQQNSSDSGAQIKTNSVDVQSYNLEDHRGSNDLNLTILSEFDNLDDTDDLYVALCQFQY